MQAIVPFQLAMLQMQNQGLEVNFEGSVKVHRVTHLLS